MKVVSDFFAYLVGGTIKVIGIVIYIALFGGWVLGQVAFVATAFAMSQGEANVLMPDDSIAGIVFIANILTVLLSFIPAWILNGFLQERYFNGAPFGSFTGGSGHRASYFLFWSVWFSVWMMSAFLSLSHIQPVN
ncbi:MAG: hypothetical protein DHS20C05_02510 [Hyphococcus sp.]|nr:MAG: hypothetical protein DHS20C05_02510 [Marinicaulis sp.]